MSIHDIVTINQDVIIIDGEINKSSIVYHIILDELFELIEQLRGFLFFFVNNINLFAKLINYLVEVIVFFYDGFDEFQITKMTHNFWFLLL